MQLSKTLILQVFEIGARYKLSLLKQPALSS